MFGPPFERLLDQEMARKFKINCVKKCIKWVNRFDDGSSAGGHKNGHKTDKNFPLHCVDYAAKCQYK
jgi:hypothetical protein